MKHVINTTYDLHVLRVLVDRLSFQLHSIEEVHQQITIDISPIFNDNCINHKWVENGEDYKCIHCNITRELSQLDTIIPDEIISKILRSHPTLLSCSRSLSKSIRHVSMQDVIKNELLNKPTHKEIWKYERVGPVLLINTSNNTGAYTYCGNTVSTLAIMDEKMTHSLKTKPFLHTPSYDTSYHKIFPCPKVFKRIIEDRLEMLNLHPEVNIDLIYQTYIGKHLKGVHTHYTSNAIYVLTTIQTQDFSNLTASGWDAIAKHIISIMETQ